MKKIAFNNSPIYYESLFCWAIGDDSKLYTMNKIHLKQILYFVHRFKKLTNITCQLNIYTDYFSTVESDVFEWNLKNLNLWEIGIFQEIQIHYFDSNLKSYDKLNTNKVDVAFCVTDSKDLTVLNANIIMLHNTKIKISCNLNDLALRIFFARL